MTDERATFEQTRTRLEEILVQVRKKDTSLEQSLDLLEEGVRLANTCNELIDQTSWRKADEDALDEGEAPEDARESVAGDTFGEPEPELGDAAVDDAGGDEPGEADTDRGALSPGEGAAGAADAVESDAAGALVDLPDDERS